MSDGRKKITTYGNGFYMCVNTQCCYNPSQVCAHNDDFVGDANVRLYKCGACKTRWVVCNCCNIFWKYNKQSRLNKFIEKISSADHSSPELCTGCKLPGKLSRNITPLSLGTEIMEYRCSSCAKDWYICKCCKLTRTTLKTLKSHVDNDEHRQLRCDLNEYQAKGNNNDSSANVHCDDELYNLSHIGGGKGSVLLCNNAKCQIHKDHSGFTSGKIKSLKQTDNDSGLSYYQMECNLCSDVWYVDCRASMRRGLFRQLRLAVSKQKKSSNQSIAIHKHPPDDYGGSDMCNENDGEDETYLNDGEDETYLPRAPKVYQGSGMCNENDGEDETSLPIEPYDYGGSGMCVENVDEDETSLLRGQNAHSTAVDELCDSMNQSLKIKEHLSKSSTFGNAASSSYFCAEQDERGGGKKKIVGKALNKEDDSQLNGQKVLTTQEIDYQLLGATVFHDMPKSKAKQVVAFINVTLNRMKETNFSANIPATSHSEVRRVYTEGSNSILQNMPVPKACNVHNDGFVSVSLEQSVNHLMANGHRLKEHRLDRDSDWFKDDGQYKSDLMREIREKLMKLKESGDIQSDCRLYIMFTWSDGFQKNSLVQTSKTELQLFTVYFVPPDEERNIQRYTVPFALGRKKKVHQTQIIQAFNEVTALETPTYRWCGIEKRMIQTVIFNAGIQNDNPERANNTQCMQNGKYHGCWGFSCDMNNNKGQSCRNCFLARLKKVVDHNHSYEQLDKQEKCELCADWWEDHDVNRLGWFPKPEKYPSVNDHDGSHNQPKAPKGRGLSQEVMIPPVKISFDFLLQAFHFAKYHFLREGGWSQGEIEDYLRSCSFHGGLIKTMIEALAEMKNDPTSSYDISPPEVWTKAVELGIKFADFVDTPMHMIFLGVVKHNMGHIERLFHGKKEIFKKFCKMTSTHLDVCSKKSITWCRTMPFHNATSVTPTGWMSDQYHAFARLSLIYFGVLEDFEDELDSEALVAFKQMVVIWFCLLSNLFEDGDTDTVAVDHYVKLFLSACCSYGKKTTRDVLNAKKKSNGTTRKRKRASKKKVSTGTKKKTLTGNKTNPKTAKKPPMKGNKNKEVYFGQTTNYFSLLNLASLIRTRGSLRSLWEGEREKYIKFIKRVLYSLQTDDAYLENVLNKLLQQHALEESMESNMYHDPDQHGRTAMCRIYNSWGSLKGESWDKGHMIFGVILKDKPGRVFVCISGEKNNGSIELLEVIFINGYGRTKLNLWYSPIEFDPEVDRMTLTDRKELNLLVADHVIMHPMVTLDGEFAKLNGHVTMTRSWRVRTQGGEFVKLVPDPSLFKTIVV